MDMQIFGLLVQDGLASGAVYVLLALALVMVFTVTRIVFVPQGEFVSASVLTIAAFQQGHAPGLAVPVAALALLACGMESAERLRQRKLAGLGGRLALLGALPLAACAFAWFGVDARSPAWMQTAAAVALVTAMGPLIYRTVFRPMGHASPLVLLVAAIALHFVLVALGLYVFGPEGSRLPGFELPAGLLAGSPVAPQTLAVVAASAVLVAAFFAFFGHTLSGKALRATAVCRDGARLVGISPDHSGELALTIAAFIGAVSGVLIGPFTTIYYDSGFLLALKGFVGAIVGGLSGYVLAAAGSLVVGLLEAFSSYGASAAKEIIVFALIVPLLLWRSLADPHSQEAS